MSSPVFSLQQISVRRDRQPILEDVSWTVERGEHWAVLGGNGSGKTSLLRVLMGYLTPTEGEVAMRGREEAVRSRSQRWDDWRRRIGFVSSSVAQMVDPGETGVEIVASGREAMINAWGRTASADIRAAERVLTQVGCGELRDRPWAWLSQGERQRLLIGRALMVRRMELLVLDEPCAGLDPVAREHFLSFLEGLIREGSVRSLVLITHHVEEIVPAITHALVLKDGRVVSSGEKRRALSSAALSEAFGAELRLRSQQGRYRLSFDGEDGDSGGGGVKEGVVARKVISL